MASRGLVVHRSIDQPPIARQDISSAVSKSDLAVILFGGGPWPSTCAPPTRLHLESWRVADSSRPLWLAHTADRGPRQLFALRAKMRAHDRRHNNLRAAQELGRYVIGHRSRIIIHYSLETLYSRLYHRFAASPEIVWSTTCRSPATCRTFHFLVPKAPLRPALSVYLPALRTPSMHRTPPRCSANAVCCVNATLHFTTLARQGVG